jgi:hypothetical protein
MLPSIKETRSHAAGNEIPFPPGTLFPPGSVVSWGVPTLELLAGRTAIVLSRQTDSFIVPLEASAADAEFLRA